MNLIKGNPQNLISSSRKLLLRRNPTLDDCILNSHDNPSRIDFIDSYEMPRHLNWKIIKKVYDIQPKNYEELVSIEGVGPSLIRALSLISQLIYGTRTSWKDPVRYSFAQGDKDGAPFSVDRNTFDKSNWFLRDAIEGEISRDQKRAALKRLTTKLKIILPRYIV